MDLFVHDILILIIFNN